MTILRFDFQREGVREALDDLDGVCLNVGAKEDPAGLKALDPERVLNCDLRATDNDYDDRPLQIDRLFDCARDRWPFEDRASALTVFGDILEHLDLPEIRFALSEARRVSERLCVTVPEDPTADAEWADTFKRGHRHRTTVTEPLLRSELEASGWTVTDWQVVDYDTSAPTGHFVSAR